LHQHASKIHDAVSARKLDVAVYDKKIRDLKPVALPSRRVPPVKSWGTVRGRIEAVDIHTEQPSFTLYELESSSAVTCRWDSKQEERAERVEELGRSLSDTRFFYVEGIVHRDAETGLPTEISPVYEIREIGPIADHAWRTAEGCAPVPSGAGLPEARLRESRDDA
jgi:hypothetical protein